MTNHKNANVTMSWTAEGFQGAQKIYDMLDAHEFMSLHGCRPMELISFVVELLFELLIQIVFEVLAECGLRCFSEPLRPRPNPWVTALGYAILGTICGALSLLPFPDLMLSSPMSRWVNLVVTPVAAGSCMAALGAWRARQGQRVLRIDRFSYGYLFALSLGLVRFFWAG